MADDGQLTIDELARRIGMTVRNIRAHQSRGLLPAPEVRGLTGYYGPDHVARLELIKELQADGFNLDLIRRLLDGAGGSSKEVLRFKQALGRPFGSDERPRQINLIELAEQWGTTDVALLEKSLEVGLLRQHADAIAETYIELFLQAVWAPFEDAGQPPERWPEVQEALERLHPLAAESLVAIFGLAMGQAVEGEFGRQVARLWSEPGEADEPAQQL